MSVTAEASTVAPVLERALAGERISDADACALLRSRDLVAVGRVANELRNRSAEPGVVTFIVDRNLNYTNVCYTDCEFCAFYRRPGDTREGYTLPKAVIFKKIEETLALDGTAVLMQGGHNPDLGIDWYEDLFRSIKARYPIHLHALSPSEIQHIARKARLTPSETLSRLRDAGLDSLPGRRRRDPGRPRAQDHLAEEDHVRRVAADHARRPPPGHEHHRDHDVGPCRDARGAGRAPAPDPRAAGRDARLPRVHLVDVPARQHRARAARDAGRRRASTTC